MKAPEKIYLEWYREGDKIYRDWCITPKTNNEPVEYTRTDAFIEKACGWLKSNLYDYAGEDDKRNIVPFDDAIFEDFKKAMED